MEAIRNIHGMVMHMELTNCSVINNGTITHLDGSYNIVDNRGTIMYNNGAPMHKEVVYRDRIVYRDRFIAQPSNDAEKQELKDELKRIQNRLAQKNREVATLQKQVAELEAQKTPREMLQRAEEMVEFLMEIGRAKDLRIRELERKAIDNYIKEQIDPWDLRPTKAQCEELLRDFGIFRTQTTEE